jgi:aspartate/methionine/tyrosine aminotransferase
MHFKCRSPDNPDGYIALAVAENRLTTDVVQQGLQAHSSFPAHMLYYQDMRGIPELRQAIAEMLQDSFMKVTLWCTVGNCPFAAGNV